MRTPFQKVAEAYSFGESLKADGIKLLNEIEYNDVIQPFESYSYMRELPCKKFLVTTGFTKIQNSKVRQMKLDKDFNKKFIIDPGLSTLTKKDVFEKILSDYNYSAEEVLVVGDDINSEIKAGQELGMETVVYDFNHEHAGKNHLNVITDLRDLDTYIF